MSLIGQIISHDQSLRVGIIRALNSAHSVMFLEGDVTNRNPEMGSLVGRTVSFDVVQTPNGLAAVNITLVRKRLSRPGEWVVVLLAPLLVVAASYGLRAELGWPLIHSYLASINLVAFMLCIIMATRPLTYQTRPAEAALFLLAVAGGAPSTLFASCLVPSKLRSDAGRFALFALIVVQLMLLYRYYPGFFTKESLEVFLSSKAASPLALPVQGVR